MTILTEIVEDVRRRVEKSKKEKPVEGMSLDRLDGRSLRGSIKDSQGFPIIGELKRASPTAGIIRNDFQVSELASSMADGGAVGISVLTESSYFDGRLGFLRKVRDSVGLPVLRKDFIIDDYQLYQAADMNADAVLLITEILGEELSSFVDIADDLGMETLVEISNENQVELVESVEPDLIGINNRNLNTMEINLERTRRILSNFSEGFTFVSESGIKSRKDVERVMENGADAVLVGTALMKSENVEDKVRSLVSG